MREIKFRIWDGNNGRFHYPDVLELNIGLEYQQYTGLKDRCGRAIYVGDIVNASTYIDETPQVLLIRYEDGCFVMDYNDLESDFVPVGWFTGVTEIIGNIHENPELSYLG